MKKKSVHVILSVVILAAMLVLNACNAATPAPAAVEPADAAPAEEVVVEEPTAAPAAEEAAPAEAEEVAEPVEEGPLPVVVEMPKEIAGGRDVEITVIGMPPESNPVGLESFNTQVARFQEMYPNVTVVGSDYAYAVDTFAGLVAGGQVPTLIEVYLTDPDRMIEQGVATDLTSYFDKHNLQDVFNPDILGITSKDGKIYGIPRFAYAMGLGYNIQMLKDAGYDTPPTTWDDLAVAAQKLTNRDEGIAGLSFITDGSSAAGWHMATIAYNFGLKNDEIVTVADGAYKAGFGSGPMVDAMNFVHDLRWEYDVLPRENLGWPTNGEALATGRAAMVVMAGDQFTWIKQTYADVDMNQFGFAPLPAGTDGKSVSLVGGNIAMISSAATPDQVEAAVYWRLWQQFEPSEVVAGFEATTMDPMAVVGQPVLPMYVGDYEAARQALQGEYANLPVANYSLFLDGVTEGNVDLQPEPLVAGQEFYGSMGAVMSTVLTEESVDPAQALQEAADVFQSNVLDQME